jgi:glycogen debranching enzyme
MKTFQFFKKTATVLAVASVALAGCGDDGGGSGTTGWVDSDPSVVEATSVEGAPKDVAEVQVMVSGGMSDAVNDQ